ncbi:unnamed protein product [Enterobius vermicularis]|uniref:acid phosphatase n=1 Tax=Enterobius vermicularis TaxID=51028 RepID=A0A0N4VK29_ENTVE|nr:unnamed protein product [Enterobius vermicularis]
MADIFPEDEPPPKTLQTVEETDVESAAKEEPKAEPETAAEPSPKKSEERKKSALLSLLKWAPYAVVVLLIAAGILIILLYTNILGQKEQKKLPAYIWRHGDRAPNKLFSQIPLPENAFPKKLGELTEIGEEQAQKLGRQLRDCYFTTSISADKVFIRSTNITRTIATAKNVIKELQLDVEIHHAVEMKEDYV